MRFDGTVLVPMTALVAAFAICIAALWFRHQARRLRHQERLAAIEAGQTLPPEGAGPAAWLLRGMMWLAGGVGISVMLGAMFLVHHDAAALGSAAVGVIPMGIGAAYLITYRLAGGRGQQSRV